MNQNLKTFKATYLKREIVLCETKESTETVLVEAKNILFARLKVRELPGCWGVISIKETRRKIKKYCVIYTILTNGIRKLVYVKAENKDRVKQKIRENFGGVQIYIHSIDKCDS